MIKQEEKRIKKEMITKNENMSFNGKNRKSNKHYKAKQLFFLIIVLTLVLD